MESSRRNIHTPHKKQETLDFSVQNRNCKLNKSRGSEITKKLTACDC